MAPALWVTLLFVCVIEVRAENASSPMADAPLIRTVSPLDAGVRLDVFLAQQPEVTTRSQARRMLDQGLVEVPDHRVRPGLTLEAGQQVRFSLDPTEARDPLQPDLPLPEIRTLYDDPDLCAIDKPVGIAAHPPEGRHRPAHTVASWARATYGELPTAPDADRPGIVHRLDRDTSGVMLVAKSQLAFDFLRAQFRDRTAEKEYRCIVYGEPRFQSDWIDRAIATDPKQPDRMAVVQEGGRESSTYYEILERFDGFCHVLCRPKTGRTHQIRVHMTSIGHSLVGDRVYRSRRRQHDQLPREAPSPGRHCLHARQLTVPHPVTQQPMTIEAPMPSDLEQLLAWLREHRPAR
jgi:23S rRNA pseudouridine1911/1915/1917 synthase